MESQTPPPPPPPPTPPTPPRAPLVARPAAGQGWAEMRAAFRWPAPARYNIAEEICERWARAQPDRVAITHLDDGDGLRDCTYGWLSRQSSRLANALAARGLARGDRCAVLLPQSPETTLTHLACCKLAAVAVPLFTLFGEDGLRFRLRDSAARAIVTDAANLPKVAAIRGDLPALEIIYCIDGPGEGALDFRRDLERARDRIAMAETGLDDPAFISYTSGTTGPPKGALHGHRVLMGHMPGFETTHDFAPRPGDRIWTPADWAWMGGLTNVMMPALATGMALVAHRMARFDPEKAFWLLRKQDIRNAFMPPTALNLLRQSGAEAAMGDWRLRSLVSAGEALGGGLLDWGRGAFGLTINEFYGQTECNAVLGNCASVFAPRAGSTGKPIPGHDVAVIDSRGKPLPDGETGEIAMRKNDPVMFLGYWNAPEKTAEKFVGDWMRTGDEAWRDADGYFHFSARKDDVITSSGYRIGPSEIEDCIAGYGPVALAAVIGLPDPIRTQAVTAYVTLKPGGSPDGLEAAVIAHVRERLSPHLAPRAVHVVEALPMTATGKIMRMDLKRQAMREGGA